MRRDSGFTVIAFPGEKHTEALGINNRGEVVGFIKLVDDYALHYGYGGVLSNDHGFVWSNGEFKRIDFPALSSGTRIHGINDKGDMVGVFGNSPGRVGAFKYSAGVFTDLSPLFPPGYSAALGINNSGQMVVSAGGRGFLLDTDGLVKSIDFPGARYTTARGINDAGDIVGDYSDPLLSKLAL